MKIALFGATGSVGPYILNEAASQGHTIVAISRNKQNYDSPNIQSVVVNYDNLDSIIKALEGCDAVIITLDDFNIQYPTQQIIKAMHQQKITRVQLLIGFGGSNEGRKQLGPLMFICTHLFRVFAYKIYRNKEAQDQLIKQSNLKYTIIQPPTLSNKKASFNYRHGNYKHKSIFGQLSRADLAHFMIKNLEEDRYLNQTVYVQQ